MHVFHDPAVYVLGGIGAFFLGGIGASGITRLISTIRGRREQP
ncbi:hypothetical protein [Streptomyces sp. Tu 6176]|nr:hypothetical protein [Streptomyces sp. Tu 6176]